jgi:hypothetical protein
VNKIQKLLKVGDLRTTGKSDEVVKLVLSNSPIFTEVVNAILTDDPGIRMRASDAGGGEKAAFDFRKDHG